MIAGLVGGKSAGEVFPWTSGIVAELPGCCTCSPSHCWVARTLSEEA